MLQQAMSRVISPVLLLNAGSNSLYLHSFIALTLHLLTGAMTTLEAPALRSQGINQTPAARCHADTQTSSHLITSPASHIPPFHGPWSHVPVISWTLELTNNMIYIKLQHLSFCFPLCLIAKYKLQKTCFV